MKKDKTVVITRAAHQADSFKALLSEQGFETFNFPVLSIQALPESKEMRESCQRTAEGQFTWLVFTSENGIRFFFERFGSGALPVQQKIAVIGEKTASALEELSGRDADLMAEEASSEGLAEALRAYRVQGATVLIPSAIETREVLEGLLRSYGATVTKTPYYETKQIIPGKECMEHLLRFDPKNLIFTFFSPSAFKATKDALRHSESILHAAMLASIGAATSQAIRAGAMRVAIEAQAASEEGLLKAISQHLARG